MNLLTEILASLLSDPKTSISLKVRILRLFSHSIFEAEPLHKPLISLAFDGEMKLVRERALGILGDRVEADRLGTWLSFIIQNYELDSFPSHYESFLSLLPRYRGDELPLEVKNKIVNVVVNGSSHWSSTLDTITSLYNSVAAINYLCEISLETKNSSIRCKAIEFMGNNQGKENVEWQTAKWNSLISSSLDFPQQDRLAILNAVATTNNISAVPLLGNALKDTDKRLQKAAFEHLQMLAESKNHKIAELANNMINELQINQSR